EETLDANWDLDIAEKLYRALFQRAIASAPNAHTAVLWNLADYFHADNFMGMTSRSNNRLDCDGRFPKMVRVGINIFIQMIHYLLQHYEVVAVDILSGNHDDVGSVFMREFMPHIFKNNPR